MNPRHLRSSGVSLVLACQPGRLPAVLHWGADLGDLAADELATLAGIRQTWLGDSEVTYPGPVPLLPELARGWLERPGLWGSRLDGQAWAPRFELAEVTSDEDQRAGGRIDLRLVDEASGLELAIGIGLDEGGLVELQGELANTGTSDYLLGGLELSLPVPGHADQLLDLTGRWAQERQPQRRPFDIGQWVRESRGGKPGLEGTGLLAAGEAGFGHRGGEVWAVHCAWPGNQLLAAQRSPNNARVLTGGELLHTGEVVLRPGESYRTPVLLGSHGLGLDEMAERFHRRVRRTERPPRAPVTWNSWEAVYFDHDEQHLTRAVEVAAGIGVERVVLDDGWFVGRRDDTSALGDWQVDLERWPRGLRPFADRVHELGMEFGLWVEPEMVSPDSELARAHPEWLFDAGHGQGPLSRQQWVLDLAHPECYRQIADGLHQLVHSIGIDSFKWDHNRYLLDAGHATTCRPGVHAQAEAYLRLLAELRETHPGLEVEACASGGGRADLATMALASRMWPSDCNDPHDRLAILRGTSLLLPPGVMGTHIGASPDHITGRRQSIAFRGYAALWGQLGVEADLPRCGPDELAELAWWIELHRRFRPLLQTGRWVHDDAPGPEPVSGGLAQLDGVVAQDGSHALFGYAALGRPVAVPPAPLRLPGLDADRRYRVEVLGPESPGAWLPPWMAGPVECRGRVLASVGLEAPTLLPDSAVLVEVTAVD